MPDRDELAQSPAWLLELARRDNHRASGGADVEIEFGGGEPLDDDAIDLDEIEFGMRELPNLTLDEVGGDATDPRYFDREGWLAILMALHSSFGSDRARGFAILETWSAKNAEKHNKKGHRRQAWKGFDKNPVREVTCRTIYHRANLACPGWRDRYHDDADRRIAEAGNADDVMMAEIAASYASEGKQVKTLAAQASAQPQPSDGHEKPKPQSVASEKPKPKPKAEAKPKTRPALAVLPLTLAEAAGPGYVRDQVVAGVNKRHALVLAGNKAAVMKFDADGKTFRLIGIEAFKTWHLNKAVGTGASEDEGEGKRKTKTTPATLWLSHPERREYEGIEFAPPGITARAGYFNLWQGFSVEPRAGECGKFLAHIRDNVAQGDAFLYNWIIGYFAQIAQQPGVKLGTALALRGPQGVGKTKVGEVFGSLFGSHYQLVADPRYVTGQFNSHMASLLLLQADEAFWAGDKRGEGKLKDLVTGTTHLLEFKGVDPIAVRNLIRLFVTGNADWLVPAAFRERRWAVIDVGISHIQDHAYFAAIDDEMNNGGREALLHHLLNFDLKAVNLRAIPQTAALLEQKFASATPEEKFWLDTLKSGRLPGAIESDPSICRKDKFYEAYIRHAGRTGNSHRAIETKVGMFLHDYVGAGLTGDQKIGYSCFTPSPWNEKVTKQTPAYKFPPLADCRARFVDKIKQDVAWGTDVVAWEADQTVAIEPAPDGREAF
jgi:hypothetical protein